MRSNRPRQRIRILLCRLPMDLLRASIVFFATKAGKTKIRLVVAHETSLAVAFQDVDVTIS